MMTKINPVGSNMTELRKDDGTIVLFSYRTPVAALVPGKGYLRTDTRYSSTTSRHITKWLDGMAAASVPQTEIDALA